MEHRNSHEIQPQHSAIATITTTAPPATISTTINPCIWKSVSHKSKTTFESRRHSSTRSTLRRYETSIDLFLFSIPVFVVLTIDSYDFACILRICCSSQILKYPHISVPFDEFYFRFDFVKTVTHFIRGVESFNGYELRALRTNQIEAKKANNEKKKTTFSLR